MNEKIEKQFWSNVLKRSDGHWVWQGSKTKRNYGRMMVDGTLYQAIRMSFAIFEGKEYSEIENLRFVKTCSVRDCINPLHLVALPK